MATISGYDSSSIGVLFSSLNSGSTKTSAMFGTSDLLGILTMPQSKMEVTQS